MAWGTWVPSCKVTTRCMKATDARSFFRGVLSITRMSSRSHSWNNCKCQPWSILKSTEPVHIIQKKIREIGDGATQLFLIVLEIYIHRYLCMYVLQSILEFIMGLFFALGDLTDTAGFFFWISFLLSSNYWLTSSTEPYRSQTKPTSAWTSLP